MNNLKILIKNNFNILAGTLQGKKKRASSIVATTFIILGALGILALCFFQAYSMFIGFAPIGLIDLCMFHAIIITIAVLVIMGVMRVSTNTKANDIDFLLALPIKKSTIVLSKLINKYLFDLFFVFLFFVPYWIFYLVYEFSISILITSIVMTFSFPLLSVGISNIVDFVIVRLFNKFKLASLYKSFFSILLYMIIFGLMLLKTFSYSFVTADSLQSYFSDRPISNAILQFLVSTNWLNVLIVLSITILPFVLGIILYIYNLGKTFLAYQSNKTTLKFGNGKSEFGILLKKEIFTYASTPAYILNTIIGPILILALGILFVMIDPDVLQLYFGMDTSNQYFVPLVAIIFCAINSLGTISSSSISLEGKNFWILKSTPVNQKQLLLAKSLLHMIIVLPTTLISSIIISIFLRLSLINCLIIFVLPTLFIAIMAFGGVLINLFLPKFDWEEEVAVVKQSMAVLVSMIAGIIVALIPLGLYLLFDNLLILHLFLITSGIYLIILIGIIMMLFTKGTNLLSKL